VLQRVAASCSGISAMNGLSFQCVEIRCIVMLLIPVYSSVFWSVAACCSVLQCVAV